MNVRDQAVQGRRSIDWASARQRSTVSVVADRPNERRLGVHRPKFLIQGVDQRRHQLRVVRHRCQELHPQRIRSDPVIGKPGPFLFVAPIFCARANPGIM